MQHIFVVGAGILGASIAWNLARGGAQVTICDPDPPGGLATRASWAWINAAWGNPEPYFHLRHGSMADWRALAQVPGVDPVWQGSLAWDLPTADLQEAAEVQARWGYDIRLVGADEAARAEPLLRQAPEVALLAPTEGAIDAVAAARALIAASPDITVLQGRVTAVSSKGVEVEGQGLIAADHVVVAAGAATPALVGPLGMAMPMQAPAGLLATSGPIPERLSKLIVSPNLHVRQRSDGSLIAGADFGGSDPGNDAEAVAGDLLRRAEGLLTLSKPLALDGWTIGHRPTPQDGLSAFGRVTDRLSIAVTHSGVTLAPIIGRLLAGEILTGTRDPLAAPFRPDRFA